MENYLQKQKEYQMLLVFINIDSKSLQNILKIVFTFGNGWFVEESIRMVEDVGQFWLMEREVVFLLVLDNGKRGGC